MITEKEYNLLNLSATKKDFYQIWNELIEVASKLSERWDPQSTNETDPGIVLLKVLTAVADKLNYNIDKNTLEAFMPTAAQDESMRKLCDMMGYSIKYYRSATTNVTLSYTGNTKEEETALPVTGLILPMFSVITNADKDISYITTAQVTLLNDQTTVEIPCIEGQLVKCENDTDNIISLAHLDELNRYYLPETQIAENGLFIYNISDNIKSDAWQQVDNLNTQPAKSKVYKFGFDSQEFRPYVQFPEDISNLIEDGIEIYFIRTSGIQGNISAKTLTTFDRPTTDDWQEYSDNDHFQVVNYSPAANGRNPETISQAYNAFKKTVGTFDTLVTCRDYINKIYSLTTSQNTYLVSNIVVSDIRDDLNKAQTICSFNDFGLCFVDKSNRAIDDFGRVTTEAAITPFDLVLYPFKSYNNLGTINDYKNSFTYSATNFNLIESLLHDSKTVAHNFVLPKRTDIVCIKNYLRLNAKISTTTKVNKIEEALIINNIKVALFNTFNMREVDFGQEIPFDMLLECIENADTRIKNVALEEPVLYTKFVTADNKEYDCASGLTDEANIAKGYYNKLVLRNLLAGKLRMFRYDTTFSYDFTERPYGKLDGVTESNVADYGVQDDFGGLIPIAGETGAYEYASQYPKKRVLDSDSGSGSDGGDTGSGSINTTQIEVLKSELLLDVSKDNLQPDGLTLNDHEVIKFRAPNFITTKTYPAYVNYFLKLQSSQSAAKSTPATFWTLGEFLDLPVDDVNHYYEGSPMKQDLSYSKEGWRILTNGQEETYWDLFINYLAAITKNDASANLIGSVYLSSTNNAQNAVAKYGAIFSKASSNQYNISYIKIPKNDTREEGTYNYIKFSEKLFTKLVRFIQSLFYKVGTDASGYIYPQYKGLYRKLAAAGSYTPGYMVDASGIKYGECTMWRSFDDPFSNGFFVQHTHLTDNYTTDSSEKDYDISLESYHTTDGLGYQETSTGIPANSEYQLQSGEYLLINYTPSSTSDDANAVTEPKNEVYKAGTIIRPNFQLVDSEFKHTVLGTSYAKISGFEFSRVDSSISNPSGMLSLGSNEQIEIRDLVKVTLRNTAANLYWVVNNSTNTLPEHEDDWISIEGDKIYKYTLKEGEFIYYTNERKQDLAYYGEGTELVLHGGEALTPDLGNEQLLSELEADELGLANIPWNALTFTEHKYLELNEYQYITLTKGDTLISLELSTGADTTELSNTWVPCEVSSIYPARYSIGDTLYTLPRIAVGTMHWEARSLLEFEMGPALAQTLYRAGASITAYADETCKHKIIKVTPSYYYDEDGTIQTDPVTGRKMVKPISIKTSENLIGSTDSMSVKTTVFEETVEGSSTTVTAKIVTVPISLKVFTNEDIKITADENTLQNTALVLHNVENAYTKISMANIRPTTEGGKAKNLLLPVTCPEADYVLMMIYYKPEAEYDAPTKNAGFTVIEGAAASKIFNYIPNIAKRTAVYQKLADYIAEWTWWPNFSSEDDEGTITYYFKPGLNIIYLDKSATLKLIPDEAGKAILIFADPTPISTDNGGIDNRLIQYQDVYKNISGTGGAQQTVKIPYTVALLQDIAAADVDNLFYYNCAIENDTAIDLSLDRLAQDDSETLLAPRSWYDPNNINNKFVISEIDANYLDTGLQIAKSSKR